MPVTIRSAGITKEQNSFNIRVLMDAIVPPPPKQVIGYKISRLTTAANRNIAGIGLQIINASAKGSRLCGMTLPSERCS
jgi:hypothetical protein